MAQLIDTNVAIYLRDLNGPIWDRVTNLSGLPLMSIMTSVELEGGVYTRPELTAWRRDRVDTLRQEIAILPFDERCAAAYGRIVKATGFARRKIADRMIAATALVHNLTLITLNGDDFRDVPGLKLEVWT